MNRKRKIIVVGGGASGLMAAARAAELGADVTVLEKMDRPARKILITGNGRCNVTTGHDLETAVAAFGANGPFLYSAFSNFYAPDMIRLMESMGVPLKQERGSRYFPGSGRASDVAGALIKKVEDCGGGIITGCRVIRIELKGTGVSGVAVSEKGKDGAGELQRRYDADSVILATGGMSYPATGSTGDGYGLAGNLGHTIIEPRPALTPIELKGRTHRDLSPLSFKNVSVGLRAAGKIIREEPGEMMFTPFGATGPAVLNLGKTVAETDDKSLFSLVIDFKPDMSEERLDALLAREMSAAGRKSVKSVLETMLPKSAVPVFLKLGGLPAEKKAGELSRIDRGTLARLLKGLSFPVAGVRPIEEAIITAGGVKLKEVNPGTLESKIVKRLYICGELLDLDAPTGGFNLQCAFSTGRLAGESAASAV